MKELHFFSCINCEHATMVNGIIYLECAHPEVAKMNFEGDGVESYTPEDWLKVDELANNRLQMRTMTMGDQTIHGFEFPFKYDPIMIISCGAFKQRDHEEYMVYKGKKR